MLSFAASIQVSTNAGHGSEYAELAAEMIWPKPSNILLRIMNIAKLHTCGASAATTTTTVASSSARACAHVLLRHQLLPLKHEQRRQKEAENHDPDVCPRDAD
jgi:hypothetical protein